MTNTQIEPTYLVSPGDIADLFRVVPSAVSNWMKRHEDFPKPVCHVARGKVALFDVRDVARWFANRWPSEAPAQPVKDWREYL